MDNGVSHIGREVTLEALGKQWTFSRWGRKTWQELANEARKDLPNPTVEMLKHIELATLKDAETTRALGQQDALIMAEWETRRKDNPTGCGPQPPLASVAYKPMADFLAEKAIEKSGVYLGFQSEELNSWILSWPGMSYLFYLLLRPKHPDMTPDLAYEVLFDIGVEQAQAVVNTCRGELRESRPNAAAAPAASTSA